MLLERGYIGLTMDRIAQATEYSKGTIYQHFSSKEDLVVALAAQTAQKRTTMFQPRRHVQRRRRSERLTAIGMASDLFVSLYPGPLPAPSSWSTRPRCGPSARPRTRRASRCCEGQCFATVAGVIRDGIAQGDLDAPRGSHGRELHVHALDDELRQLLHPLHRQSRSSSSASIPRPPCSPRSARCSTATAGAPSPSELGLRRPPPTASRQEVFPDEFQRLHSR